jgi:hypothetical protein
MSASRLRAEGTTHFIYILVLRYPFVGVQKKGLFTVMALDVGFEG